MLALTVLALLVLGCSADSCPNVEPSSTFDANKLSGTWYILMHTEQREHDSGCCKCVESMYSRNSEGFVTANRTGHKNDGSLYNTVTGLRPESGSNGRYFHLRKSADSWMETGMKVVFYMVDSDCMGIFGCMPKDNAFHRMAVFMCRSHDDTTKKDQFKTWLTEKGVAFDNYYNVDHTNCNH